MAVLTIRRPEVLGALDEDVFRELDGHLAEVAADDGILGAVITGFGVKAFVSGADVRTLARIRGPEDGERLSRASHEVSEPGCRASRNPSCAPSTEWRSVAGTSWRWRATPGSAGRD